MIRLRPCPRCGSVSVIVEKRKDPKPQDFRPWFRPICRECGLTSDTAWLYEDRAAAWWNARPIEERGQA